MAITRIKNSGIKNGVLKYDSALGGYPGVMPAPTAADAGTGSSATVTFSAISGATSYTALSTPGSLTGTGASSPITVSGLTAGTAYTFQVRATNSTGTGAYSAASNSITPAVPAAYESIASATGTGSSGTITFSSISSSYTRLQFRIHALGTTASQIILMRFNGDTGTNYARHNLNGTTTSPVAGGQITQSSINIGPYNGTRTGFPIVSIVDLHDYTSTTRNKTARAFTGLDNASTGGAVSLYSGLWLNTSAINSVSFVLSGGSFTTATTISMYGIKGA